MKSNVKTFKSKCEKIAKLNAKREPINQKINKTAFELKELLIEEVHDIIKACICPDSFASLGHVVGYDFTKGIYYFKIAYCSAEYPFSYSYLEENAKENLMKEIRNKLKPIIIGSKNVSL